MTWKLFLAVTLLSSVSACNEDNASAATRGRATDSSDGVVALASQPYRATTLSAVGRVAGQVYPGGETLVWIDGISTGKPLGEIRRYTVTIENGRFVPGIQDVPVGSTINIFTRDRVGHSATFMRGEESVAVIRTMDAGQVVPSESIASRAGVVEAKMDNPPGATAYIAAFDHPYHTVTDQSGVFRIDSLPPGTYTIKMWRSGMPQPDSQRVAISAGGVGQIAFGDISQSQGQSQSPLNPSDSLRP